MQVGYRALNVSRVNADRGRHPAPRVCLGTRQPLGPRDFPGNPLEPTGPGESPPGTPFIAPAIQLPGSEFLIRLTLSSWQRLLYGSVGRRQFFIHEKMPRLPTSLSAVIVRSKGSIKTKHSGSLFGPRFKRKKKGLFVSSEMVNRMLTTRL